MLCGYVGIVEGHHITSTMETQKEKKMQSSRFRASEAGVMKTGKARSGVADSEIDL